MSRSNPNSGSEKPTSPATKFMEWDSDNKQFKYYDKETKQNVDVKLPFSFLVLDTLASIKGWSQDTNSQIWSNEIKNIKTDTLTVMTKKGVEARGTYEQIKGKVSGAKYCQSVYIAYHDGKELAIANIQMKGAALGSWIEFCNPGKGFERPNLLTGAVKVASTSEGKVGKIVFNKPVFTYVKEVSEKAQLQATELDKKLQAYFVEYFAYVKGFDSKEEAPAAMAPNNEFAVQGGGATQATAQNFSQPSTRSTQTFEDTVTPTFDMSMDEDDLPFNLG